MLPNLKPVIQKLCERERERESRNIVNDVILLLQNYQRNVKQDKGSFSTVRLKFV